MDPKHFRRTWSDDQRLDTAEIQQAADADMLESRSTLLPQVRAHAELLTTGFDMIDEQHRAAGDTLAEWIVKSYQPGKPLAITFVCTGNSRRSILGATMGNVAAAYYGLPEVHCFSGGTAPTAFNSRTIATLKEIGPRDRGHWQGSVSGRAKTANPIHRIRWGQATTPAEPGAEATEFSKHYADPSNPQQDFAALMVCSEADGACPFVRGAALRVSMPYLDPKTYDGSVFEAAKYAERRDDIGRLMLAVMMQARHRLAAAGKVR